MTMVEKNVAAEKMVEANAKFVSVWFNGKGDAYITDFGDDEKKVYDEGYFRWAMIHEYDGRFKVFPREEVAVLN